MTSNDVSAPASNDPLGLRREDLAGLVASYQGAARGRREFARYEIHCPACDVSLLGPPSKHGGVTYAELAIATGCCPACGAHILAP